MSLRTARGSFRRRSPFFLVPASDRGGHYVTMSAQVPRSLKRRVDDICHEGIATGKYPWRSPGDLHRYLLVIGLEELHRRFDPDDDTVHIYQVLHTVEGWRTTREEAQRLLEAVIDEVSTLLSLSHNKQATQRIHGIVPTILALEDQMWREWIVRQLQQRFPMLFEADQPFASLLQVRPKHVLGPKARRKPSRRKR